MKLALDIDAAINKANAVGESQVHRLPRLRIQQFDSPLKEIFGINFIAFVERRFQWVLSQVTAPYLLTFSFDDVLAPQTATLAAMDPSGETLASLELELTPWGDGMSATLQIKQDSLDPENEIQDTLRRIASDSMAYYEIITAVELPDEESEHSSTSGVGMTQDINPWLIQGSQMDDMVPRLARKLDQEGFKTI